MNILLLDNNIGQTKGCEYNRMDVAELFPLSGKKISELCKEFTNLLVFPNSIATTEDKIGDATILDILNTEDPNRVTLRTNNIMGFIGYGNHQIKIQSRFDAHRNDFLLHYMIQRVLSINLFDLQHHSEQEDILDLMMFMFPYFLKTAFRQGVYREYQRRSYNDSNIKGAVDINRHITKNPVFCGKVAYTTREYAYDNSMTQLIRHTIEFMRLKRLGQAALNIDYETKENISTLMEYTASYDFQQRSHVIQQNLRMKSHPYYTAYRPLQTLCLQILRMEEVKYGEDKESVYGILFDGAWLWEEYVNTILDEKGFIHPKNKLSKGGIYLFKDQHEGKAVLSGRRFPDFYKKGMVLDAKYKKMEDYETVSHVDRNDIHQIMTYMYVLKAMRGGFVAPLSIQPAVPPSSHIQGSDATVSIFGIEISKEPQSYHTFCKEMLENELAFIKQVEYE
jgi:5-methylcytosine-specific restriction endonuclease McrBC regulatory subunit McrC